MTSNVDHIHVEAVRSDIPLLVRLTAWSAAIGLLLTLAGAWVATRTVATPVQDCGVAAAFLLDGRVDVIADPENPPAGLTAEQVEENNDSPCQERAANQARPGLLLVISGVGLGLVAFATETLTRWRWRRKRVRAEHIDVGTNLH